MDDNNVTLAVLSSKLDDIKNDIDNIRKEMSEFQKTFVSKNEWLMRNQVVDERFQSIGKEIVDAKLNIQEKANKVDLNKVITELESKRAPWWSIAALIISAFSLIYSTFIIP